MRTRFKQSTVAFVGAAALAATLAACGSSSSGGTNSHNASGGASGFIGNASGTLDTANSGTPVKGGTLTGTIEKNITDWNTNSAAGATEDTVYVMDNVYPMGPFNVTPSGQVYLDTNMMISADQTNTSPQTLVYKIKPNAVWSDGKPINVDDFIYAWKTNDLAICPKCEAASGGAGYSQIKSITGSDNGKTVTVVMSKPYADWKGMFSQALLPSHLVMTPAQLAHPNPTALANSFNVTLDKLPTWSGGPYIISKFVANQYVELTPNPKWYGTSGPYLSKLIFRIITDATTEPTALQNKEVDEIFPQPEIDLFNQVKQIPGIKYQLAAGSEFEHFDFNLKNPFLQDLTLRKAIFTAVNTKAIIARTVGQFDNQVTPLGNRILFPGAPGFTDNETPSGFGSGNVTAAKQMLTSAGYKIQNGSLYTPKGQKVPTLVMRYTVGNAIRQTECQIFQQEVAPLGIHINIETTDDLGGTLTHAAGKDYDIIVFAFVDTPFPAAGAQEMFTGSPLTSEDYGYYKNAKVASLIAKASAQTDVASENNYLDQADKLVNADAYMLSLYQKPDFLAYYPNLVNLRLNGWTVGPEYNSFQWGLTSATS